jgi:hypothetical protein
VLPFLRAGASSVVATWWTTSDAADSIFWSRFYELLINHRLPPGAAVWQARLAVHRRLADSPDWLAYTLMGDPLAQPYVPDISEGYTTLECLGCDEFLRPGLPVTFRATIRRSPPLWYEERLVQTEELPQQVQALFLAPGIQAEPPQPVPMQAVGQTMVQAEFELTPPAVGDYPLLVQLMDGDEHMTTLQMTLQVREQSTGEQQHA